MSLSFDLAPLFSYASLMFNSLSPIAFIGAGFTLGIGLITLIVKVVGNALKTVG